MIGGNLAGFLDVLATQELLLGVFLAIAGLVFILFGFRVSGVLVALSFGVLGFVLCMMTLPLPDDARLVASFIGALGLGAASTFFRKPSIALLSGIWAGYAFLLLAGSFDIPKEAVWGIAAIGFVSAASLTLIAHREVIAFVLSLEGTALLIGGFIVFTNQSPTMWNHLRGLLMDNPIFAPFLLLAGTVTGFYWQLSELRQRDTGVAA